MAQATDARQLWVTVPCKGRLSFLQRTAPAWFEQPDVGYCLVDFDCPDRCGDWLEQTFAAEVAAGRAVVERVVGQRYFHKAAAHNAGARRIAAAGGEYVAFADADVSCRPGFAAWLLARLSPDRFWIAGTDAAGWEHPGLVGLLALPVSVFRQSGGFDEQFRDWGAEDLEYRLRLRLEHGLDYGEIPIELLDGLPHGDELRVEHYEVKDLERSHLRNQVYLARKLQKRLGKSLAALDDRAQRLIRRVRHRARGPAPPGESVAAPNDESGPRATNGAMGHAR